MLAGSLLQQLYSTVDSIVVSNFASEAALSAVGTTGSFTFLFLALATGFSAGNGVVVAQHYGAGDEKQVRANASTGILLLLGMRIFAMALGLLVSRPAFVHFVAGFHWGVVGAAVATDIAQAGSFAAAYFYMTRKYPAFRFSLKELTWDFRLAKNTLKAGFPIALQLIIVSFGLTFIQRAVNGFKQAMTASFTVGYRIELYLNLPCSAFQTTLATYIGQNIGAGKVERVKKGVWQALLMSLLLTLCISGIVWIFAGNIVDLFHLSDQAAVYCNAHIRTIALINIILSLYIPLFGVFQGANHGGAATLVAVGALGMRVFTTYLFRYSPIFGHTIIWWNGLFGFGTGFLITWTYYLSNRWQKKSAIQQQIIN